ncbi:hypothetical protein DK419_20155 [Methylobacterium terrae]|uniref:Uncharacterized protein n=2 Tax=Methylobacterium terrae TaxID=2202827 RepID=A0A2U8WVK8_9HYPH|nr:hypothetical protein [Methylobacterium terrae]AWN50143.1 hypothetical protein DK419_20155 [Methylobacterium terrae]
MGYGARLLAGTIAFGLAGPALAADLPGPGPWPEPRPAPSAPPLRYFPRGDSDASLGPRVRAECQDFVPTNAPGDPTYVGSPFGLGKPSYYGFPPPRGVDDPYGRRPGRRCL